MLKPIEVYEIIVEEIDGGTPVHKCNSYLDTFYVPTNSIIVSNKLIRLPSACLYDLLNILERKSIAHEKSSDIVVNETIKVEGF